MPAKPSGTSSLAPHAATPRLRRSTLQAPTPLSPTLRCRPAVLSAIVPQGGTEALAAAGRRQAHRRRPLMTPCVQKQDTFCSWPMCTLVEIKKIPHNTLSNPIHTRSFSDLAQPFQISPLRRPSPVAGSPGVPASSPVRTASPTARPHNPCSPACQPANPQHILAQHEALSKANVVRRPVRYLW